MEVFSGMPEGLHQLLRDGPDLHGYERALPRMSDIWRERESAAIADWGGVLTMGADGAVLGLQPMDAGVRLG
jgi:hypothetical protein